MQTHNLKDLRNPNYINSYRPGSRYIVSQEYSWMDYAAKMTRALYHTTIRTYVGIVKSEMLIVYGRTFFIPGNKISDVYLEVRDIQALSNKSMLEVVQEIRSYLNYKCNFYRKEGKRFVPVSFSRIKKAYMAIKAKETPVQVENILYF